MERGREDGSRIGRRNRSRSRRGDKRQDVEIGPRRVRVGAVVQWCSGAVQVVEESGGNKRVGRPEEEWTRRRGGVGVSLFVHSHKHCTEIHS